jgi:hypothetical protein
MFRHSLVILVGLAAASPAAAGTWADGMFSELSKDFGSVARGPTLVHPFRVVNNTKHTVVIGNVRVSCGCTSAAALKTRLAPGEETAVLAHMNTSKFSGNKTVTIFVRFDEPEWVEVRLWVQANSRDDVSVQPESLAFGQAKRGTSPSASVTVTFLGAPDTQLTGAKCQTNYVKVSYQLAGRDLTGVSYKVTAGIRPDAPVGKWYTDVWLQTTNPVMPKLRVPLTIEIEAPLTVSVPTLALGKVKVGGQAERRLIVRGVKPFKITAIKGADEQLLVRDNTTGSRAVHVLTVTLKGTKQGEVKKTVKLVTDLKDQGGVEFQAVGLVLTK